MLDPDEAASLINPLAMPVLHLNGSGTRNLIDWRGNAVRALDKAIAALREAYPNQRDYYPDPDRWTPACSLWDRRIADVERVKREIEAEMIVISDLNDARGRS